MTFKRAVPGLTGPSLAALVTLAACSPPPAPTPQARADRATTAACRQRADEVYLRQNRASLYTQDARDTPESSSYVSGITSRGLADRYGWDSQVSDCVRNQGSTDGAATTQPPLAAPGPAMVPRPH